MLDAALRWAMEPHAIGVAHAASERSTPVELDIESGGHASESGIFDPDLRRLDGRMRQIAQLNEELARKNSYLATVLTQVSFARCLQHILAVGLFGLLI